MNAPNETDLRESMQHVAFEFYHFELYGKLIQRWINGNMTCHSGLYQAVGYEFLIHFRALLDFFFAVGGQDDDLLLSDFCILPSFAASFPAPGPPLWVKQVKRQLNKRLAHITSPRWAEPAPSMNEYHQHFPEICTLISSFKDALPPDMRHQIERFEAGWVQRDRDL
jgi:hypothetical protein